MSKILTLGDVANSGAGILHAQAVNDAGYDKTKDSRVAPEVKISKIYARCGSVVIVGSENGAPVEKQITVNEAVLRCKALLEMVKQPQKYRSDQAEIRRLLESFIKAIDDVKAQLANVSHKIRG